MSAADQAFLNPTQDVTVYYFQKNLKNTTLDTLKVLACLTNFFLTCAV